MTPVDYESIRKRLLAFYAPEDADKWLHDPHPLLHFRRAVDCSFEEVEWVVDQLELSAQAKRPHR